MNKHQVPNVGKTTADKQTFCLLHIETNTENRIEWNNKNSRAYYHFLLLIKGR